MFLGKYLTSTTVISTSNSFGFYDSSTFKSIINKYIPLISSRLDSYQNSMHFSRRKLKIAILGAGIGGCSTAYFLEDMFSLDNEIELQIDIYDRENQIGGKRSRIQTNGREYDLNPILIDFTQVYMKKFARDSGCKLSNSADYGHLRALFDSNGIIGHERGNFLTLYNVKMLLKNLHFKSVFEIFKWFFEYLKYKHRIYKLQDSHYSFDNIEKLLRKTNPHIFTFSQHSFREWIDKFKNKVFLQNLSNIACLSIVGQNNNVPGLVGLSSLIRFFFSSYLNDDKKLIADYLIANCQSTRLHLNTHVKSVSYDNNQPNYKNKLTLVHNFRESTKSYDYVIITFPLTKSIKNQNFSLDILYRDFLDCEMKHLYNCVVYGKQSIISPDNPRTTSYNLFTVDSNVKFQSLQSYSPVVDGSNSTVGKSRLQQHDDRKLYKITSTKVLNDCVFDSCFEPDYLIVKKFQSSCTPLYKKVRYSHTPFPQIVIDGAARSRVFYLNGLEWLESSKETNCIAARNIAILIAKRELSRESMKNSLNLTEKFAHTSHYSNILRGLVCLPVFFGLGFYFLIKNKQ